MGISIITSLICDVFGLSQGNAIVAGKIGLRGDKQRSRSVSKRHAASCAAGHTTFTRCYATAATATARLLHWLVPMQAPQWAMVRVVPVSRVSVVRAS